MMIKILNFFVFIAFLPFFQQQNCEPFAAHVSLSNYYNFTNSYSLSISSNNTSNEENKTLSIVFQTKNYCSNISIAVLNDSNMTILGSPDIRNFSFEAVNSTTNITKFIYNFSLSIEYTPFGKTIDFSIIYNNESNASVLTKNFSSKLPYRDVENNNSTQKFLFMGMMDNSTISQKTFSRVLERANKNISDANSIDLVIYLGDMAFNLQDDNFQKGDVFLNSLESFATRVPFMATPGIRDNYSNYEYFNDLFGIYDHTSDFYSYNVGKVHFIQINMARYFTEDESFRDLANSLLDNDLKNATLKENRMVRPWIIVYGYYSFYCSYQEDESCTLTLSNIRNSTIKMEYYLSTYQVDLFFSSHYPIYQRSKPLSQNKIYNFTSLIYPDPSFYYMVNPKAVVYIVEGVGGNNVTKLPTNPQSNLFLVNFSSPGYGILTVINNTYLFYQHFHSSDNKIADQFYIKNEIPKWDELWTPQQEYLFIVCTVIFVFLGIIIIGVFQIYVDGVM